MKSACPLDCYDACVITDGLKGEKSDPITRGYLCPKMVHFEEYPLLKEARIGERLVTLEEAIAYAIDHLGDSTLYYRGSGNVGLMQRVMEHFFAAHGSVGTSGSLCDGAGEAGIALGREVNTLLRYDQIAQSEVVILWGRNVETTQSHLLPFLKDKRLIVIDPIRTKLAQKATLHLPIQPHCDLELALLLSRFAIIEGMEDCPFIEAHTEGFEEFYELTQTLRIKKTLERTGLSLVDIGTILAEVKGKKTTILIGLGVQKYRNGADVVRAIDAFGAILGLFHREGCGVGFLGNSWEGVHNPFRTCHTRIPKPLVDFGAYETLFIHAANPLAQHPNTARVREQWARASRRIYFGTYENETSRACDVVIPAKSFLAKADVRSSYGDPSLKRMRPMREEPWGISEYALAERLCGAFGYEIESEEAIIEILCAHEGSVRVEQKKIEHFCFMDEIDWEHPKGEGLFLITPKHPKGLNSQFHREEVCYLHPALGFEEGCEVELRSLIGACRMRVAHDTRLREDCILIYSGTFGVNYLTSHHMSSEGHNALYQEYKIKVNHV